MKGPFNFIGITLQLIMDLLLACLAVEELKKYLNSLLM
jgi:hypothetical protein